MFKKIEALRQTGWHTRWIGVLVLSLVACGTPMKPLPSSVSEQVVQIRAHQRLTPISWHDLPGWADDDLQGTMQALHANCQRLAKQAAWQMVCAASEIVDPNDANEMRRFFESFFTPYQLANSDGSTTGLITGYYEPMLKGALTRHGPYQYALYHRPKYVLPKEKLPTREQLMHSGMLKGDELVWVDDPVEAFFLQVQGSGQIQLDNGSIMRLGFGGSNNQPYASIGTWLMKTQGLAPNQVTMQGIKQWVKAHPHLLDRLFNQNPRFIFFQVLSIEPAVFCEGPVGALGVPLTAMRSIAVDPSQIALGTPVFLKTAYSAAHQPLNRLVFAQDTGSAIKGTIRADFFWGTGDAAGEKAGVMKASGQLWLLYPKEEVSEVK